MVAMDSPSNFTRGTPWGGGGYPPAAVLQKCIPVVLRYKEVRCPHIPIGHLVDLDELYQEPQRNHSIAVRIPLLGPWENFLRKKNFLWLQWILHKILRGVPGGVGGTPPPTERLCPSKMYTSRYVLYTVDTTGPFLIINFTFLFNLISEKLLHSYIQLI